MAASGRSSIYRKIYTCFYWLLLECTKLVSKEESVYRRYNFSGTSLYVQNIAIDTRLNKKKMTVSNFDCFDIVHLKYHVTYCLKALDKYYTYW